MNNRIFRKNFVFTFVSVMREVFLALLPESPKFITVMELVILLKLLICLKIIILS